MQLSRQGEASFHLAFQKSGFNSQLAMRLLWGLPNFRERLLPAADVEMCGRDTLTARPPPLPHVQVSPTRRWELAQSGLVLLALLVPSSVMAAVVLDEPLSL